MTRKKNLIPPSTLRSLLLTAAVTVLTSHHVKATPYASMVTNIGSSTIQFYLNESGGNVTITYDAGGPGNTNASYNGVTTGLNLAAGAHTFSLAGHTSFTISVYKIGAGVPTLIASSPAFTPRGVDVNKNTTSPFFGRVYVDMSIGSGITALNPDMTYAYGGAKNPTGGGCVWFGGGFSPYRCFVAADDYLMVGDASETAGASGASQNDGVWRVDPNLNTAQLFLGPRGYTAGEAAGVHATIQSRPVIVGNPSTGPVTLLQVDGDFPAVNGLNSLLVYKNITLAALPWQNPPDIQGPEIGLNLASATLGGNSYPGLQVHGNYIYAGTYRENYSNPCFQVYTNDIGVGDTLAPVWNSLYAPGSGDYFHITVGGSSHGTVDVAVSEDGLYGAAVSIDNWFVICPLTNGIPDPSRIFNNIPTSYSGNARGIAFDQADNMYVSSSGLGLVQSWSLGLTTTANTTGNASGSTGFALIVPSTQVSVVATTPNASQGGNNGTPGTPVPGVFTITRTSGGAGLTVNFTLGGTATNGVYTVNTGMTPATANSVFMPAGVTSTNIIITPTTANVPRLQTTVLLSLAGGSGYGTTFPFSDTVYIQNTSSNELVLTASAATMYKAFSNDFASVLLTRMGDINATAYTVLANAFSYSGSAVSGTDFTPMSAVTFNPGDLTHTATISPLSNGVPPVDTINPAYAGNKSTTVTLAGGASYGVAATANSTTLTLLDNAYPASTVLFADPLTDPADAANWGITYGNGNEAVVPTDYTVDFGYDLTASNPNAGVNGLIGLPPSGATTALRVTCNKNSGAGSMYGGGVNLYYTNKLFQGNYAVRFNMNLVNGDNSFTVEGVTFGINHNGLETNWWLGNGFSSSGPWASDGVWYWIQAPPGGYGGFGFSEFQEYTGTTALPNTGSQQLATATASTYRNVFKGVVFSALGTISGGTPANNSPVSVTPKDNNWSDVEIKQTNNVVTLSIDHTTIFTYANTTTFKSGYLMLGYNCPIQGAFNQYIGTPDAAAYFSNLRIVSLDGAPVITSQPQNAAVAPGNSASFTVTATGTAPLTYEWGVWCPFDDPRWPDCGCTPMATCSPNLPTLTLTDVSPGQAGGYYVIITNAYGAATSQVATLTVTNPACVPPVITHAGYSAGTSTLSFQSMVGFIYEIQYKNTLTASAWTVLPSVLATSTTTTGQDVLATGGSRFYRVVCDGPTPTTPLTVLEPPGAPPAQPGAPSGCSAGAQDDSLPYLFSGEFYQEIKDLPITGRGMNFAWARKYRSKVGINTVAGNGWDFSYNIQVVPNGTNYDVSGGNNRIDTYHLQENGTYGANQLFCEGTVSNNVFTLKYPDTGTWVFRSLDGSSAQGKIASINDRNSNSLTFAYSGSGLLTNIVDTLGRKIQIGYNADGFISSITDFAGRQVQYAYYQNGDAGGSLGDLKSVTSPAVTGTPNGNDFPLGKTVTYTYSTGFSNERLNHNLLTITDAQGQLWLSNTYASTTNAADYNFDQLVSQVRGYSGEVLTFYRKSQPPIPQNQFAVTKAIVNDRVGDVSEYLFDSMNNLVRLRQFTGRAVPGVTTTETANRPTGKLRSWEPDFFETSYAWNADSKLTQIVLPNGNSIQNTYELALNPNASRRSRSNLRARTTLPGLLGGDQAAITETFVYDTTFGCGCGFNFATQVTDGRSNTTYHAYDSHGNRTNTIYPVPSSVESYEYNQFGQTTAHVLPDNGSGYRRRDLMVYYTSGAQNGYLRQSITDTNGFALTTSYAYDTVGNIVRTVDPRQDDITNIVNQLNQVVEEISSAVSTTSGLVRYQRFFSYDANNNLVQADVQDMDENGVLSANPYLTTTYAYDILNLLTNTVQEVDQSHNVVTQYAYDANRNRILVRSGEAANGHQPNNVVSTLYDERNLQYHVIRAPGDPGQSTTQSDYDANGNLIRTSQGLEDGAGVRYTTFGLDGFNRRTTTTDAMGNVTTTHYDANGNMASSRVDGEMVDVAGSAGNVRLAQTTYIYDALNRRVQADRSFFDTVTGTNIAGGHAISQTIYSPDSQVLKTIDADSHTNSTAYDTANRPSLVTDAKGNTTAYTYDANGNVLSTTEVDRSDLGSSSQTFTTTNQYDAQNRLVQTVDNVGNTNRSAFDSRDNRGLAIDGRGNVTRFTYDGLNRLTATTRFLTSNGNGSGTPAGTIVTTQSWDDDSRLTGQTDANTNTTAYVYDTLNRMTRTMFADGTTNGVTYDVHDNQIVFSDANLNVVNTTYDLDNRATARAITRGPGVQGTTAESYQHDGLSRTTRNQNDDSVATQSYDSLSHVVRETQQVLPGGPVRTVASAYDGEGDRLSSTYPGGRIVNSTYDNLNRHQTISDLSGTIAAYGYFGPGRVERRDYGNGTRAVYGYDPIRRLTNSLQSVILGGAPIDSRAYTWDAAHNQTAMNDLLAPALDARSFSYDSWGRLTQSVTAVAGPTISYSLDGVGNRLNVTGGTNAGSYFMNPAAPPADFPMNQYTTTPFDARTNDANGNLTVAGEEYFVYNYRNQCVAAYHFDGASFAQTFSAKHDCFGRRMEKVGVASTNRFYYAGWQEIEEQDGANVTVATYAWGNGIDELLTMDRGGQRRFYHADDLGSIRKVTDSTGSVVEEYRYSDYGEPFFFNGLGTPVAGTQIGNFTLFTGRRYDPETGLFYYRTRCLDPRAGRFTTRDTIGIWGDSGNMGNGVAIVGNNPWSRVDPLGFLWSRVYPEIDAFNAAQKAAGLDWLWRKTGVLGGDPFVRGTDGISAGIIAGGKGNDDSNGGDKLTGMGSSLGLSSTTSTVLRPDITRFSLDTGVMTGGRGAASSFINIIDPPKPNPGDGKCHSFMYDPYAPKTCRRISQPNMGPAGRIPDTCSLGVWAFCMDIDSHGRMKGGNVWVDFGQIPCYDYRCTNWREPGEVTLQWVGPLPIGYGGSFTATLTK